MNPSLLITPNAVKAGKLYSIIPTNGAGDLDVVRATSATRVNSAGLIETVGNNIARLDYSNGSCPSILVEAQRTNLCLQSEMFTQSPWTGIATISANTNIAPDGTLTADTLTDSSTSTFRLISQTISVSANSTIASSVFIKKTTGTPTNYPAISVQFTGVSLRVARLILNTTTGTFTISPDSSITPIGRVVSYNNYWRIEMTVTDNGNNTSANFAFYPAISSDGTTLSASATGSAVFWGAQFEIGSNATSYIPTTTATVTRNADVISKSGISSLIGQTEGSVLLNFFYPNNITNIIELFNVWNSSTNYLIRCRINSTGINVLSIFYLSVLNVSRMLTNTITLTPNSTNKICIVYNYATNTTKLFANGVLISSTVGVEPYPTNTQDKIGIGNWFGVSNTSIFNNIGIWKTQLSDAEAIQLTTL